jgi:fatty-acyl-CoA synthase
MLRPDAAPVTAAEVIQFCRANVAGYKTPRHITFVDEFPRTAAGKIRKHLLTPERNAPAR